MPNCFSRLRGCLIVLFCFALLNCLWPFAFSLTVFIGFALSAFLGFCFALLFFSAFALPTVTVFSHIYMQGIFPNYFCFALPNFFSCSFCLPSFFPWLFLCLTVFSCSCIPAFPKTEYNVILQFY